MMRISNGGFPNAVFLAKLTAATLSGLLMAGCVTRSLTIKTNPAGAMVYVNDVLKGKTPVTYDFTWYGWHRVMIRKDGFKRVDDRKMLRAPIYLWIPIDLVMELLPFHIHDDRAWEYTLTPQTEQTPLPPQLFTKPATLSTYTEKPKPAEEVKPLPVLPSTSVEVKAEVSSSVQAAATEPQALPDKKEGVK